MPQLPSPLRAAIGLAAEAAEQARHLPDKAIELPMLAVSTALQLSLRAQQRYAMLAAKGEEILNHRPATDEPPPWATFDDPVSAPFPPEVARFPEPHDEPSGEPGSGPAGDPGSGPGPKPRSAPGKSVRAPRNNAPSRFDSVDDD